jgi:hypothetical protein
MANDKHGVTKAMSAYERAADVRDAIMWGGPIAVGLALVAAVGAAVMEAASPTAIMGSVAALVVVLVVSGLVASEVAQGWQQEVRNAMNVAMASREAGETSSGRSCDNCGREKCGVRHHTSDPVYTGSGCGSWEVMAAIDDAEDGVSELQRCKQKIAEYEIELSEERDKVAKSRETVREVLRQYDGERQLQWVAQVKRGDVPAREPNGNNRAGRVGFEDVLIVVVPGTNEIVPVMMIATVHDAHEGDWLMCVDGMRQPAVRAEVLAAIDKARSGAKP